jgi:hypothetical protein
MRSVGRTALRTATALGLMLAAGIVIQGSLDVVEHRTIWKMPDLLVSEAQAGRWGMGATPVRATGVARRTARRCADGTYNC